jgi:hypothetical protein
LVPAERLVPNAKPNEYGEFCLQFRLPNGALLKPKRCGGRKVFVVPFKCHLIFTVREYASVSVFRFSGCKEMKEVFGFKLFNVSYRLFYVETCYSLVPFSRILISLGTLENKVFKERMSVNFVASGQNQSRTRRIILKTGVLVSNANRKHYTYSPH